MATVMGPCGFTTDSHQNQIVEASPEPDDFQPHWPQSLGATEAIELALQYRIAVSGALDLFDRHALDRNIRHFAGDPARSCWPNAASLYLVLALGAQARAQDRLDEIIAQHCFILGREQAAAALKGTPDISMVQAYCMIAWYLLTASRRSVATMYLGLAVQAAYSIGIHRQEANATFGEEDKKFRERVWKTLRVCDIFLSATMGRPSTTSHVACNVDLDSSANMTNLGEGYVRLEHRQASAITRLCLIFEQILCVVYSMHGLSLRSAKSISERHRKWTVDFSETSKADSLSPGTDHDIDPAIVFGSATLLMAYHYSIILLTRPFLTLHVKTRVDQKSSQTQAKRDHMDVTTYSDACVSSAIKIIDLAYEFSSKPLSPNRSPLLLNSTFISALSLGLAYFGNYKSSDWPLERALTRATTILKRLGTHNPQAARHSTIIEELWEAAKHYELSDKDNTMRARNQRVSKMFGDVSVEDSSSASPTFVGSGFVATNTAVSNQSPSRLPFNAQSTFGGSDLGTFGAVKTGRNYPAQPAPSLFGFEASEESSMQHYPHPDARNQGDFLSNTTPTDLIDFAFDDQAPLFYLASNYWTGES